VSLSGRIGCGRARFGGSAEHVPLPAWFHVFLQASPFHAFPW
jgi:hypothetical protein